MVCRETRDKFRKCYEDNGRPWDEMKFYASWRKTSVGDTIKRLVKLSSVVKIFLEQDNKWSKETQKRGKNFCKSTKIRCSFRDSRIWPMSFTLSRRQTETQSTEM